MQQNEIELMLELDSDFLGRKKKSMGAGISGGEPPWAHEAGGAPCRGGRALDPRGQVFAPPAMFSVLDILKYSRKDHISISGHLENFYFWGILYCTDNSENRQENTIFTFLSTKQQKVKRGYRRLCLLVPSIS